MKGEDRMDRHTPDRIPADRGLLVSRDALAALLAEEGVDDLHSWRCSHPGVYGECSCLPDLADAILSSSWLARVKREAAAAAFEEAATDWAADYEGEVVWLLERAAAIRTEPTS